MLAEDPHKALGMAKNMTEIAQARSAIAEFEAVRPKKHLLNHQKLVKTIQASLNTNPSKPTIYSNANKSFLSTNQARNARPAIDLSNDADNEDLPDAEAPSQTTSRRGRKPKIPVPAAAKTAGFTPFGARRARGRGARGTRGSARGKAPKAGPSRGGKRKTESVDIDTSVATIEESEVETDEEETPNLARVRKLVAKANQGAVADGEIEPVHKIIKDGDCRVAAAEQVPQLTVQDVMPQGERDQVDQNPNLPVHSGEGMIDFVLVKENHARTANGKAKGMSLPKEDEFRSIVNNAIVNMVTINMGWCNVVERSGVTKAGLGLMKLNYGYPDGVAVFRLSLIHI